MLCGVERPYTLKISEPTAANQAAKMIITGYISSEDNNGAAFEQAIDELAEKNDTIEIHVINCFGGSTYQGMVIHDAIKNCKAKTITITKGLSASMGTPISLAGNHGVYMAKNSRLMMHRAIAGKAGNADELRAEAENLENVENELAEVIAAKCGKDVAFVKDNYLSKGDLYMTAIQAKKAGLIDDVIDGHIKDVPQNILKANSPQAIADYYQSQIKENRNPNINTMKDIAIAVSALQVANPEFKASNESEVIAEITAQGKLLKSANKKITELEAKVQKSEEDKAIALVEAAKESDKIDANQKDHFEKLAKQDYDSVKALFDGMESHEPASRRFNPGGGKDPRADWNWDKFSKEDPRALAEIKEKDPDRYNELYNAKFKS